MAVEFCAQMSMSASSQIENVVLNPAESPAILSQEALRPFAGSADRCCACLRGDVPAGSLRLCTLAGDGELFRICRLCFLFSEVRELSTAGGISSGLLEYVDLQLHELYGLLRGELEVRSNGSR